MKTLLSIFLISITGIWLLNKDGEYVCEIIRDGKLVAYVTIYCSPAEYEKFKEAAKSAENVEQVAILANTFSDTWVCENGLTEIQSLDQINTIIE